MDKIAGYTLLLVAILTFVRRVALKKSADKEVPRYLVWVVVGSAVLGVILSGWGVAIDQAIHYAADAVKHVIQEFRQ